MSERPTVEAAGSEKKKSKIRLLRRLYNWVLHWADTPYGTPALATISFAESSFFPIPPDPLLLALTLGRPRRWFTYALVCTSASVLGGLLGYWIGYAAFTAIGDRIIDFYGLQEGIEELQSKFNEWGFAAVLGAALTPIPYKLITITAGTCTLDLSTFVVASVVGRGLRFFVVALLVGLFGEPIRGFIDRYFNLLCLLFFVILILGFVVIRVFL